jgi:hypothetical protein
MYMQKNWSSKENVMAAFVAPAEEILKVTKLAKYFGCSESQVLRGCFRVGMLELEKDDKTEARLHVIRSGKLEK